MLKLTNRLVPGPKPHVFIMAAIHARELATAEVATRFAEQLVARYGVDPDVTWLLDYNEIHILAQSNPDGRKLAEVNAVNPNPSNENVLLAQEREQRPVPRRPLRRGPQPQQQLQVGGLRSRLLLKRRTLRPGLPRRRPRLRTGNTGDRDLYPGALPRRARAERRRRRAPRHAGRHDLAALLFPARPLPLGLARAAGAQPGGPAHAGAQVRLLHGLRRLPVGPTTAST